MPLAFATLRLAVSSCKQAVGRGSKIPGTPKTLLVKGKIDPDCWGLLDPEPSTSSALTALAATLAAARLIFSGISCCRRSTEEPQSKERRESRMEIQSIHAAVVVVVAAGDGFAGVLL